MSEGAYAFAFSASEVGDYQMWIFAGSNPVPGSPFLVRYVAGPPHPRGCKVVGLGLWTAESGKEAEFEWAAKDKHGNQVGTCEPNSCLPMLLQRRMCRIPNVVLSHFPNNRKIQVMHGGHEFVCNVFGPEEIPFKIEDTGTGVYKAKYTPTIAGQHRISILYQGDHLAGSPFLVTVKESASDPSMSTVTGEGLEDCLVGEDRHFLVEAVDRFGNRVVHGGDAFKAEMKGPVPEKVHLIDMDDGTYAGTFMCRWSGDFALIVTLDGTPVGLSPYMISVKAGATLAQVKAGPRENPWRRWKRNAIARTGSHEQMPRPLFTTLSESSIPLTQLRVQDFQVPKH